MDPTLVKLTAGALAGLASKDHERHGCVPPSADDIGRRAVEMAKGALAALKAIGADGEYTHGEWKAPGERAGDLAEISRRLGGAEDEPVFAVVDRAAAALRSRQRPDAAHPDPHVNTLHDEHKAKQKRGG